MLSVIMPNAIMVNSIIVNAIMLNVIMLNSIMVNAIMLNAILLSVEAPRELYCLIPLSLSLEPTRVELLVGVYSNGRLLALPKNIRLGW
jgi:hypothetical protein